MTTTDIYWRYHQSVAELSRLANADLGRAWGSIDLPKDAAILMGLIDDLVDTYGIAAGTLAADFYDEVRDSLAVPKRFRAIVNEPKPAGSASLIGWAASKATDDDSLMSLVDGGVQRRIVNVARETIITSSRQDRQSKGWMRIGSGDSCPFCEMLISRGAVYKEDTVDFAAHDHCHCQAAPAFNDVQIMQVRKEFKPTQRYKSDEARHNARTNVKAWLRDNPNVG